MKRILESSMQIQISFPVLVLFLLLNSCVNSQLDKAEAVTGNFQIGWASADITPTEPVILLGQWHARISEGVMDPLTVTALAIESGSGPTSEKVVLISCDLCDIADDLTCENHFREKVRELLKVSLPELKSEQIIINATHTHTAPFSSSASVKDIYGIDLDVMPPAAYMDFVTLRIAETARQAWENRQPGGMSYGLGQAVVGHNRLVTYLSGESTLYGRTNTPEFSHIEGYEDHNVGLIYTWDNRKELNGLVINIACPSQVSGNEYQVSADFWHDVRVEIQSRLGSHINIFPQCGAAGDQSPHAVVEAPAEKRMQQLMFPGTETGRSSLGCRKQIAVRIADAVTSVIPYVKNDIDWNPVVAHQMEVAELSKRLISIEDVNMAVEEREIWKNQYEQLLHEIAENPAIKDKPRWFTDISKAYSSMWYSQSIQERYNLYKTQPRLPVEVHVVRIGDIIIATNPFELYLDYGIRIKQRSPAIQTFIVQLANGYAGYLPTERSVERGGYGSTPTESFVGPEGGQELVERTVEMIYKVME